MDMLLGIICAVLIDIAFALIRDENVKPIYRKLLLAIITVFYLLLTYVLICLAIKVSELAATLAFSFIVLILLLYVIKLWMQVYKKQPC